MNRTNRDEPRRARLGQLVDKLVELNTHPTGNGATPKQRRVLRRFWRVATLVYEAQIGKRVPRNNALRYY